MHIITTNKVARHDYAISDTLEVGMKLTGAEVKSVKNGSVNLKGSFVTIKDGVLQLINCHISPYPFARQEDYDPTHARVLLAHAKEVQRFSEALQEKGLTLIPLDVHLMGNKIKLTVGLGRGKKKWDKREDIKKRDIDREIRRQNN